MKTTTEEIDMFEFKKCAACGEQKLVTKFKAENFNVCKECDDKRTVNFQLDGFEIKFKQKKLD
jgi:ribosomal protein L32